VEFDVVLLRQLKVHLVYQAGRLQSAGRLPAQIARGQPAEFAVDDRQELFERAAVPAAPLFE